MSLPLVREKAPLVLGCALIRDFKVVFGNGDASIRMTLTNPPGKTWYYDEVLPEEAAGKAIRRICDVAGVTCTDAISGRMVRFALHGSPVPDTACEMVQLGHIIEHRYHNVATVLDAAPDCKILQDALTSSELEIMRIADTRLGRIEGGTGKMRLEIDLSVGRDNCGAEKAIWFVPSLEFLNQCLIQLEVKSWEELKGRYVRVRRLGRREKVVSIGHIFNPNKVVMKPGIESSLADSTVES